MKKEVLKDSTYRILGYIETNDDGSQTLKDPQYKILGSYYPKINTTKTLQGKIIGFGNLLAKLLP